ncbi:hypothetical protein DSO57_1012699 [Entomophthora muscae]|uniref:Uncharacterized protein n=1 Tax=Entomophthora muscae TaxID=34485 RepID=A0ACC2SIP7_9FUNG|nr:hypothetical protein DSO57_1012699 [Entomophthora muscae]
MLVPLFKFVVYTLAPALVILWSTSPDLWGRISHSFHRVGANPNQFLHIFEDIPGRAQDILTTSENVVRSLACNDLEFPALKPAPSMPPGLFFPMPLPSEDPIFQVQEDGFGTQESAPKRAPWLLDGMILMGLDSYFPQLSDMYSLWTPLQAAIPVLHWMVSWWILPPGWEPNLVSLAPLSHINHLIMRMLKWYLVQVIPASAYLCASDLAIKALQHLKPNNIKLVLTQKQLVKFISDKMIATNSPPPKAFNVLSECTLTHELKQVPIRV